MVHFTYIDKYNTIVSGSEINTGLNPVSELVYGKDGIVSRGMIYFDHSAIKGMYEGGIMPSLDKMTHVLRIKNAGAIDQRDLHSCGVSSVGDNYKFRAVSFDLIFFLIPKKWDRGKGFNYVKTYFNTGFYSPTPSDPDRMSSTHGSNWFQRVDGIRWDEEGIYGNGKLSEEYDKWASGDESVVIARQHFDIGNEDIEVDITDVVNKFITGELENNGIGIAYSPMTEVSDIGTEQYSSWLTDKTNTFFEPYVETRYCDRIMDDRSNFVVGKKNRLYLYSTIGQGLKGLDTPPKVTIRDSDGNVVRGVSGAMYDGIESQKFSTGVYYVDVRIDASAYEEGTMLYDTWSGISYDGNKIGDVELDFVLTASDNFFNIGTSISSTNVTFSTSVSGIQEREEILRGDIRKLVINARPSYSANTYRLIDDMDIRLYVMDGKSEVTVIGWDYVNKAFNENFYLIDTGMLIPHTYHVDVRIRYGMNTIIHHDVLSFSIVNDVTDKYA